MSRVGSVRLLLALSLLLPGCYTAKLVRVNQGGAEISPLREVRADQVKVVRPGVGQLTPIPRRLWKGDKVLTGPSTQVLLRFIRAYVLISPGTQVTLGSLDDVRPNPELIRSGEGRDPEPACTETEEEGTEEEVAIVEKPESSGWFGEIFARVEDWNDFASRDQWVQIIDEGTRYEFQSWHDERSVVQVYEGAVVLTPRQGTWKRVRVDEGERAVSAAGALPEKAPLTSTDMDTLDSAFQALDRMIGLWVF